MQASIDAFLSSKRIALVGFSRSGKDFSRMLDTEFRKRGVEVVPVNPDATELDGRRCFPSVSAITPPVEGALILVPAARAEAVVRDCLDAGVKRVWLHRGAGAGSASPAALALCAARGVTPVSDLCPFMALPAASWPHKLHGWFRHH
jgi:predicted CoA-binding protein